MGGITIPGSTLKTLEYGPQGHGLMVSTGEATSMAGLEDLKSLFLP